jgi:hypothetical protein
MLYSVTEGAWEIDGCSASKAWGDQQAQKAKGLMMRRGSL